MHGVIEKRSRKSGAVAKLRNGPARRAPARHATPLAAGADTPLVLRISPRLNRALSRIEKKTGRPKHYHVRRALERYLEDTWDSLLADEALKSTRRTHSTAEVKKYLGMED